MATGSSINQTGGIGYSYEDQVGAYLLAAALLGAEPRPGLGPAARLDFQTKNAGWALDDLLYTSEDGSRCALSIKSAHQFSANGAAADFTRAAWSDLLALGANEFDEETDTLGLAAPRPDAAVAKCLAELTRWAAMQDPAALQAQMETEGAVSDIHRALWRSLACPSEFAEGLSEGERSPARLLGRLRLIWLDLLSMDSAEQTQAQLWCTLALVEPTDRDKLWGALVALVAERRPNGGFVDVDALPGELGQFDLAGRLDFRADWERLRRLSDEAQRRVRVTIAGLSVAREGALARLEDAAVSERAIALIGPSGCGKTVIARQWIQARQEQSLWLGGAELEALERGRAGLRHPIEKVIAAAPAPLTLIIDGLDRQFEQAPFRLTARLIEASRSQSMTILLTCQEQEFARLSDELRVQNADVGWKLVAVGPFNAAQLAEVLREAPELAQLSGRSRLGGILRRPKVLDTFAGRISAPAASATAPEHPGEDESAVARWFWDLALGSGPQRQRRGAVLLELAREQGDRLRSSIPLEELSDTAPLDELVRDGILTILEGRVGFAHDLYGDWSRSQILLAHREELAEFLAERSRSPLWHGAIRLYALGLLGGDGSRWGEEIRALGGEGPGALGDLFLDALILAADAEAALESAWELLVADKGRLLARLLSRFRHIATVPDPYMMSIFRAAAADISVVAAAKNRVPYAPLWPPLLRVLAKHAEQAVEFADAELAETLDIWLRRVPAPNPERPACAALVLAGAEQILRQAAEPGTYVAGELIAVHLRAAMATGGEDPERLRVLLGAFIAPEPVPPPPPGARAPTPEAQRLLDSNPFDDEDDEAPLLGYGALDSFRELCLDTDALVPVIEAEPDLAAEVLEAAIVPRRRRPRRAFRRHHALEDFGVPDFYKWSQPLWLRGPFLQFLRTDPQRAIRMIVAITNQASERYLEALADEEEEFFAPITIKIDGRAAEWPGNEVVYLWYRGDSRAPKTVASALMALEKCLYDQIDAEENVDDAIEQLLAESRSLAFAGLLLAVGFRRPALFSGPLRPLLGVADLYRLDHLRAMQSTLQYEIGGFLELELMQKMIGEWHGMAHRKIELEQVAQRLLLSDPELTEWMSGVLERWRDEGREETHHLAARLDASNWTSTTLPDGREAWEYQHPPELVEESTEAMAEASENLFWLQFPSKMRTAIDAKENNYDEEQLEGFWADIVEAKVMGDPPENVREDGVFTARDAPCGAAAFLLLRGGGWLQTHPEREAWCRDTLLEGGRTPLKPHFMESAEDVSDWGYDRFCADALPLIWAEDSGDRRVREAIALLATNIHHNTIARLYRGSASQRGRLDGGFTELQSLAVAIARWKTRRRLARQVSDEAAGKAAHEELTGHLERFVASELEPIALDLRSSSSSETDQPAPSARPLARRRRRRPRSRPLIDLSHIWAAWSWMPDFAEAMDEDERRLWLGFWREMVGSITAHIAEEAGSHGGGAYGYENAVLLGLPERILSLADPEEARSLWVPLLASGADGERWISPFLTAWFGVVLGAEAPPPRFAERWREMLEFVTENWTEDPNYDAQASWRSLLGVGRWQTAEGWGQSLAPLIASTLSFYERWAADHLADSESFAAFCRFLVAPAASALLEPGLVWLQSAAANERTRLSERNEEDLLSLLATVATKMPALPRSDKEAGEAYRALLAAAVERHNPIALALHERIFGAESSS
jgi:hypothetical protein